MAVFNFGWLNAGDTEPLDNGLQLQLGGNYRFDARAPFPTIKIHKIEVQGMRYYTSGGNIDLTSHLRYSGGPELNIMKLEEFYLEHECWKPFQLQHPIYGLILVKFDKPWIRPKPMAGGTGIAPTMTIALREQV